MAHYHPILTSKSIVVLAGMIGFFAFLNGGFSGPLHSKWDMPRLTKERYQDIPEIAALFPPDMHPALKKDE